MPDVFYIALAYGLTGIVVVGYAILLVRRARAAEARLAAARSALGREDDGDGGSATGIGAGAAPGAHTSDIDVGDVSDTGDERWTP
ncbi:MAG: hypothetical protein ACODAE_03540 [Gemmatimonadota bacterium]